MTRIEEGKEVFVHASDIQLFDDESVFSILTWQPTIVLASGPPLYLPQIYCNAKKRTLIFPSFPLVTSPSGRISISSSSAKIPAIFACNALSP